MTHFAHDLGADFEPYFGSMLELLMSVSASKDLNIVQWTFNCLAYLFKYLSRLLTTDLRPTYRVISPVLGKSHQRDFVTRFAAESLSFLIRKCTGESLKNIVEAIMDDVIAEKNPEFFSAMALLLSDSVKSSGNNLHSRTRAIISVVLHSAYSSNDKVYLGDMVFQMLVDILQHCRQDTSEPLYQECYSFIKLHTPEDEQERYFNVLILLALAGLRKGSRVTDWNTLFECSVAVLSTKIENLTSTDPEISLIVSLLQCLDFQVLVKYSAKLLDAVCGSTVTFISLCSLILRVNQQIFKDHVLRYVNKLISQEISDDAVKTSLFLFLIQLQTAGLVGFSEDMTPGMLYLSRDSPIVAQVLKDTKSLDVSQTKSLEYLDILLQIINFIPKLPFDAVHNLTKLLNKLESAPHSTVKSDSVGKIFSVLAKSVDHTELLELLALGVEEINTNHNYQILDGIRDILGQMRYGYLKKKKPPFIY